MGRLLPVDTILYCDNDPFPRSVLQQRMKTGDLKKVPIHNDIRTLQPPPCDIIIGGFPCQDIAQAGLQAGFDGARSSLYHEILRLADVSKPKYLFLENVRNITLMPNVWKVVLQTLHEKQYDASWCLVAANHTGAPHRRWRWFCMAKKRKIPSNNIIRFGSNDKMPHYGDMRNGNISTYEKPSFTPFFFKKNKILRKLENVPCKGKIRHKDKVIRLWSTPTCHSSTCKNLTCRRSNDYYNQVKFELDTTLRSKYVNLNFTEWVMGLPLGWTDPKSEKVLPHNNYSQEPCKRMVPDMPDNYHKRVKTLGNLCVSQQAKLAWDILMPRMQQTVMASPWHNSS